MLPKQLMFTVGLIDQITKPIAKISKQFNGLADGYQRGTMKMATGAGGMAAAGYALTNALQPAIDMDRALGEVKSLGVRDSALKELSNTAYDFALKYGKSSTEFIKSSYDIQSAISGLNDADLSAFTMSSNILAAATKADAATVTNYMGTMYGIFKNQATGMGKSKWVEQVTGMTATAVQMFKTTGAEMSGAFTSIGAEATSAGIGMNEQMAILGTLQATMSGSEAGTKYKAFLAGVGKAQKELGLKFIDAQGQMLPMVNILEKIKGKYGDTIDVAEGDELKKAFGSKEAVATVKLLMNDINALNGSISDLGKVKGMEQAQKMAAAMTDQSERLSQSWFVIRAAFGTAILPVFNEFASWLADVGRDLVTFTEQHPTLTKYLGYTAIALVGLVAAGGLFTLMMGASTMAMTTWRAVTMVAGLAASGFSTIITGMQASMSGLTFSTMLYTSKLWLKNKALAVGNVATSIYAKTVGMAKLALSRFHTTALFTGGYLPALGSVMMGAASSTWAFVASLAAAALPFTIIIGLVAGVAVAVYKYWQPIKAFLGGFWDGLVEGFAPVGEVFGSLFESFSFLGDIFSWMGEQVGFSSTELAGFAEAGKSFGGTIASVFNALLWPIKQFINLLTGGINLIKDAIGAVADFFGFGDEVKVSAELTQKQLVAFALPENVVPMPNARQATGDLVSIPFANQQLPNQANNVVPFKQPVVDAQLVKQSQANQVAGFAQPVVNAELVKQTQANTVIPFKQPVVDAQLVKQTQANTVIPFKQPVVDAQLVKQTQANTVVPFKQPVVNAQLVKQSQANQVAGFAQPVVNAQLVKQSQANQVVPESLKRIQSMNKPENNTNVLDIPALKIERAKAQASLVNNNRNENNADNSKRVFIDNLTMKSDDINQTFDQLMELAG